MFKRSFWQRKSLILLFFGFVCLSLFAVAEPSTPTILFPSSNTTNVHPQFTIHINRITGISRMVVEADTAANFSSGLKKTWTVESASLSGTSINGTLTWSRTLSGLEFGKNYKLRVR
ncbi:hypothetical protein QWY31_12825, partial [Cytophagales bacterium LB-30]